MLNDTDLPGTAAGGPSTGFDANYHPVLAAPPARFGRLALCVAAAGALAFGVMATVAYGVWFNHDQRAYAEAMASARQALGVTALAAPALRASSTPTPTPTPTAVPSTAAAPNATAATTGEEGGELASWSGQVMRSQRSPSGPTQTQAPTQAAVAGTAPASSVHAARGVASSPDAPTQQPVATGRAGKDGRAAPQDRHLRPASAKPKGGLLARMSLFFRRVNYRQHGTGRQQDPYAHP
ncbi:hypothetical protein [Paraburkholderia fungorum]|uniref:hypothetical protein n=1 Tax=Paraburkholderia fungorum TaxID=134537 RepID=UPI0038BD029F